MTPVLLSVALDCFREPLAYQHLKAAGLTLTAGFDSHLTDLCVAVAPGRVEETARLTGIDVEELLLATRFFVRQTLLPPGADHYRCLGLTPDASADMIRMHYRLLIGLFHPDRDDISSLADQSVAARLNAAYGTLRDDVARTHYDALLRRSADVKQPAGPESLLRRSESVISAAAPRASARSRPLLSSNRRWRWLIAVLAAMLMMILLPFISMQRTPELRAHRESPVPPPVPAYLTDAAQTLLIAPAPQNSASALGTSGGAPVVVPAVPGMPSAESLGD